MVTVKSCKAAACAIARTSQEALRPRVGGVRVISHDVAICLITLLPAATDAAATRCGALLRFMLLLLLLFFCRAGALLAACRAVGQAQKKSTWTAEQAQSVHKQALLQESGCP
jgi:hypothetical protein